MQIKIDLADGKYTYLFDNGKQKALRYGEPWRDLTGDKLVFCLAARVEELEQENRQLKGGHTGPVVDAAYAAMYRLNDLMGLYFPQRVTEDAHSRRDVELVFDTLARYSQQQENGDE